MHIGTNIVSKAECRVVNCLKTKNSLKHLQTKNSLNKPSITKTHWHKHCVNRIVPIFVPMRKTKKALSKSYKPKTPSKHIGT
jgi:hypothetical protein